MAGPELDPFADPLLGTDLGNYHLESVLGQGGMGTVYRAVHRELGRPTAVKVLPADAGEWGADVIARFHDEAMAHTRVRHPNVVRIFESGRDRDVNYLALELVEGRTLTALAAAEGPASVERLVEVGRELCSALAAIHAAGLVHRDIKPSNIVLTPEGALKLLDFGVVHRRVGPGAAGDGEAVGTLRCMAPEVQAGSPGDPRSDLFQVGALLYELLTGTLANAIDREWRAEVERAFFAGPPGEVRPDVPDALKDLVLRCIDRTPALRFQSASTLGRELERVARLPAGQRSRARPGQAPAPGANLPPPLAAVVAALAPFVAARPLWQLAAAAASLFLLLALSVAVVLTRLGSSPPPPPPPTSSAPRSLGSGDVFEVRGGLTAAAVRWDLPDAEGVAFLGSYRDVSGVEVPVTFPLPGSSGSKTIPLGDLDPRRPTELDWRLERKGSPLARGSTPLGFHEEFAPPGAGGALGAGKGRPRALWRLDGQRFLIADPDGVLHGLDFGPRSAAPLAWSVRVATGGVARVAGLLLSGDGAHVSLEGATARMARLSWRSRAAAWAASDRRVPLEFGPPVGGEWQSSPFVGRSVRHAATAGAAVVTVSSLERQGRVFATAFDAGDGRLLATKAWEGRAPVVPAAVGSLALVGFLGARPAVVLMDPARGQELWRYEPPEPLTGSLIVAPGADFVYFQSAVALYRLALLLPPPPGERLFSTSLGDLRAALPGPCSGFAVGESALYASCVVDGATAAVAEFPLGGEHRLAFVVRRLPLVVRDGGRSLRAGPPPLVVADGVAAAVGDSLCLVPQARDAAPPRLIRFPEPVAGLWYDRPRLAVVLASGRVLRTVVEP